MTIRSDVVGSAGTWKWAVLVAVAALVLVMIGSWAYWRAEGGGSPTELRQRVSDAGLAVDWTDNGPRSGDGFVATDCGARAVSIDAIGVELFVTVDGDRQLLDEASIEQILGCREG